MNPRLLQEYHVGLEKISVEDKKEADRMNEMALHFVSEMSKKVFDNREQLLVDFMQYLKISENEYAISTVETLLNKNYFYYIFHIMYVKYLQQLNKLYKFQSFMEIDTSHIVSFYEQCVLIFEHVHTEGYVDIQDDGYEIVDKKEEDWEYLE